MQERLRFVRLAQRAAPWWAWRSRSRLRRKEAAILEVGREALAQLDAAQHRKEAPPP